MRYAVLSDIHSNLEAFTSVLKRIGELKTDRIICLGDIVGYNANPNECVAIIKDLAVTSVCGNHDEEAVATVTPRNLNTAAELSILWTRQALSKTHKVFLRELPVTTEVDGLFTAFHTPGGTENKYIHSGCAAKAVFERMRESKASRKSISIAFFGHTHVRSVFMQEKEMIFEKSPEQAITLEENRLYLINPGSVGQPRGGDTRASFLTFDTTAIKIEFHHVEYDVETTAAKIIKAGLPKINAKRITLGQ